MMRLSESNEEDVPRPIHENAVEFLVEGKIIKFTKMLSIAPECRILLAKFKKSSEGHSSELPW
jgi:hypothetical protein